MRKNIGIIGSGLISKEAYKFCMELGSALVTEGYRLINGGAGGVMEATFRGARESKSYFEGSTVGILKGHRKSDANKYCDIIIPTETGISQNIIIINTSDILIAVSGGAGTLSEIAFAWQKNKTVLCVTLFDGWAKQLAATKLDKKNVDLLIPVSSIDEIINYLK